MVKSAKGGKTAAAKKKPAASGRPKKAETAPKAAAQNEPTPSQAASNHPLDPQETRLLVEVHLPKIKELRAKVSTATANLRNAYKTAKSEGFTKSDFDTAIAMEDAEREARERAAITRKLVIARMMQAKLGDQLDMFLRDVVVDASQIAREEGAADSAAGKSAKPDKYAPGTKEYDAYMSAYHDDQEKRIKSGIKKKADEAPAKTPPEDVTSGVPVSRSAFLKQQAAEQAAAQQQDDGEDEGEDEGGDDEDEPSAFERTG